MARFFRTSLLLAAAALVASGAMANIPDPDLSTVPQMITTQPNLLLTLNTVVVVGGQGPITGATVDLIMVNNSADLLCWCPGETPDSWSEVTDGSGTCNFDIAGGGCVDEDRFEDQVSELYADGILMYRPGFNSVDILDNGGNLATDANYDPATDGVCAVNSGDASYFGSALLGSVFEPCTKFNGQALTFPTNAGDLAVFTPHILGSSSCTYTAFP